MQDANSKAFYWEMERKAPEDRASLHTAWCRFARGGRPGRTDVLQGSAPCQWCHWATLLCGWWSASTQHNAEHLRDISCTGAYRDGRHGQQGKLFSSLSVATQILHFQALSEPSWAGKNYSEAPNRHCLNLACALPRCAPTTLHLRCVDHLRRFWKRPEVLQLRRN